MSTLVKNIYLHKSAIASQRAYKFKVLGDQDGWAKEMKRHLYYKELASGGNPNVQLLINPITPRL